MKKLFLLSINVMLLFAACNNRTEDNTETEQPKDQDEISYKHVIKVGKDKEYKTVSAAASAAKDSTLVEIDAGLYSGDVAFWGQKEIYVRAVGGEVILDANGKSQGGKGIWEVAGKLKVEGITFKNAKVPDQNGAGIRLSSGELIVDNCRFLYNENGILTGNSGGFITLRNSEFGYGGHGDGYSHNIYIGYIDKAVITGCYFHHAQVGHLLKCRAKTSIVQYCRITDENDTDSRASYELDFPSGGVHVVVGNIIQQSVNTENPAIVDFAGEQNDKWSENRLYLSYNTVLNGKTGTNPLFLASDKIPDKSVYLFNNLLSENIQMPAETKINVSAGNHIYKKTEINANYMPSAELVAKISDKIEKDIDKYLTAELKSQNISLIPAYQYVHQRDIKKLTAAPKIAGAMQN